MRFKAWLESHLNLGYYWIFPSGSVFNVTNSSHSVIARKYLQQQFASKLKARNWYECQMKLAQHFNVANFDQVLDKLKSDKNPSYEDLIVADGKALTLHYDEREHMVLRYNWKVLRDQNIETKNLLEEDFRIIANGLNQIQNIPGDTVFNIYAYSSKKEVKFTFDEIASSARGGKSRFDNDDSISHLRGNANLQVRDIDIQNLHPFYRNRSSPLGD